ncbi:MAG: tRNA (adenosine(37)-N6)-dimethylallyltransferase MiaA [Candidatus Magasanikbacteria bacterium]|nr:tRNA (adenosine(37)-N6)-dimethylallyltransferase MiaA [Candidatus Magasanikbacteria bacterium]
MREEKKLPKLIVILGPTACGKTSWSLKLSKKFNGEVISADSRQIYKKMDIGTAKEPGEWKRNGLRKTYYIEGIPHHLLDFLDPGKRFTVAEFRDKALKYAKMAQKNDRIPIIAGGTGLYIQSIVDNYRIPRIPPNKKLRQSLEEKQNKELVRLLEKMDQKAAKRIDRNNKRRIIRALEVCILSGESFSEQREKGEPLFETLQIGIDVPREVLYDRINMRVDEMMKMGLLKEIEGLLKQKYSWSLPSMSGIGYRQFKGYFEGEKKLEECVNLLKRDTRRYAKRQIAWFKRDQRINWMSDYEEAEKLVKTFLK